MTSEGNPLFEWRMAESVYLRLFIGGDDVFEWNTIDRDAEYAAVGKGDPRQINVLKLRTRQIDVIDVPSGHVAVVELRTGKIDLIEPCS